MEYTELASEMVALLGKELKVVRRRNNELETQLAKNMVSLDDVRYLTSFSNCLPMVE